MVGGTLGFVRNDNPSEAETIQTVGSGTTDDDEVIFVNKLDQAFQPLALQVFQYGSTLLNTAPTVATIVVGNHCDLGSTSTVERAHVDNNGRVHVAGSSMITPVGLTDGRKFNWLMQFNVTDAGTTGPIRCGTRTFATFGGPPPGTLSTIEAFEFIDQSIYLLSTYPSGGLIPTTSTPRLIRFQNGTGGLVPDLIYQPTLATNSGNMTPMHRGRILMLDVRPTVPRLLLGGDRDFQNLDEDPFLVRMITAPMFANGFE
ncbi:MAG: hypothetical protein IPK97_05955 [Ahniella sp.]|nr:hypothetical protein [Ahniella sp.]